MTLLKDTKCLPFCRSAVGDKNMKAFSEQVIFLCRFWAGALKMVPLALCALPAAAVCLLTVAGSESPWPGHGSLCHFP